LRLALGDSPDQPVYIETIPRHGYCFVGRVERRTELTRAVAVHAESSSTQSISESVTASSVGRVLRNRLPGFLKSGWAAAVLLCGVLIGMGIVLLAHRPS
jgi:hypothetical protein